MKFNNIPIRSNLSPPLIVHNMGKLRGDLFACTFAAIVKCTRGGICARKQQIQRQFQIRDRLDRLFLR